MTVRLGVIHIGSSFAGVCVCVRAQKCQDVLVVIAIGFQSDDVVLLLSACPRWCAHVFVCVRWVFVVLCCVVCACVCVRCLWVCVVV